MANPQVISARSNELKFPLGDTTDTKIPHPPWTDDVISSVLDQIPETVERLLFVGTGLTGLVIQVAERYRDMNIVAVLPNMTEIRTAREKVKDLQLSTATRTVVFISQELNAFRQFRSRHWFDAAIFMPFPHRDEAVDDLSSGLLRGCTYFVNLLAKNGLFIVCDLMVPAEMEQQTIDQERFLDPIVHQVDATDRWIQGEYERMQAICSEENLPRWLSKGLDYSAGKPLWMKKSLSVTLAKHYGFDVNRLQDYKMKDLVYLLYRISHREYSVTRARNNGSHHLTTMEWYRKALTLLQFEILNEQRILPKSFSDMWHEQYGYSQETAQELAMFGMIVTRRLPF